MFVEPTARVASILVNWKKDKDRLHLFQKF